MEKMHTHSLIYVLLFLASAACGQTKKNIGNSNNIETKIDTPKTTYNEHYYYKLGEKASQNGDYKQAIVYYSKTVEINPDYLIAYLDRANCYREMYYFKKAIKDVKLVISKDQDNPLAYNELGNIYFSKANPIEAIKYLDKAIKISPSYGKAYYNRAYILNEIGQKAKACADWKKAASLGYVNARKRLEEHCNK